MIGYDSLVRFLQISRSGFGIHTVIISIHDYILCSSVSCIAYASQYLRENIGIVLIGNSVCGVVKLPVKPGEDKLLAVRILPGFRGCILRIRIPVFLIDHFVEGFAGVAVSCRLICFL